MLLRNDGGEERVDVLLCRLLPQLSRSAVQKLCDSGQVLCGGVPVKKNYRAAPNEVFDVTLPQAQPLTLAPQEIALDVVYEDEDIIVVNKPKGMVVHPAAGHWDGTLVNALLYHCGNSLSGINGELRPGIVHRIDKDTSGLLIAAKNDFAHRALAAQLQDHTLARTYECVVCGHLRESSGTVNAPIGRHPTDRKRMAVVSNGRAAVTHYEVIAALSGYSYVRCRLETGRTHQIRVHMAYLGHPILGDTVYGHKKAELGMDTQCLHAKQLQFLHPRTGKPMRLCCPLPEDFRRILRCLGFSQEALS